MSERRGLVLITVDAWRADFAGTFEGIELVPALAPHAAHTARFTDAYAAGPWTSPGLISIFTGESAAGHGVHYEWSAPRPGGPALAATLRDAGFAVPNLCYLNRVGNYANLGYDPARSPGYPHGPAEDGLLGALAAQRGGRDPFFLWTHYKWVHLPYWASAPYRARLGIDEGAIPQRLWDSVCTGFVVPRWQHHLEPEDRALVRRLYAAGVLEMSAWLAQVLDAIFGDAELAERTTVVLTADHGDELLDHGHVGHASTSHHATLFEEVLRIPLFVLDRRIGGARRIGRAAGDGPVHGMDLFPTLLALAGVAPPASPGPFGALDLSARALGRGGPLPDRPLYFASSRRGYQTPREMEHHFIEALLYGGGIL